MIRRYPVESHTIHWKHVANDQWTCTVTGVAEVIGKFQFPPHGVYVLHGSEEIRKFAASWASNKALLDLFGKD